MVGGGARPVGLVIGLAVVLACLHGLNRWQAPDRGPWADSDSIGVIVGSSNVLYALDAPLLDSLSSWGPGSWTNRSVEGLAGAALLSEACAWAAAWPAGVPGKLVVEVIGNPVEEVATDWRLAGQITAQDFAQSHLHAHRSSPGRGQQRLRASLEHLLMRTTRGLHAVLHPADAPPDYRLRRARTWAVRSPSDSARWDVLLEQERAMRTAGTAPDRAAHQYPPHLMARLASTCARKGIELVPVVSAAGPTPDLVAPATRSFGRPPVLLDGGRSPSPFVTPHLMCDPLHLNAAGARLVTLDCWNQLAN